MGNAKQIAGSLLDYKKEPGRRRLVLLISVSGALLSSGPVWSQCATQAPSPVSVSGSEVCTDTGVTRRSDTATASAVDVEGGTYIGTGVTLETTINNAFGIDLRGDGRVDLLNATITTASPGSYGIRADSGQINAENLTIVTNGYGADAITLTGPAIVNLKGAQLLARGASARGVRVQDGGSVVGANVHIETTQSSSLPPVADPDNPPKYGLSHGVLVQTGSSVVLSDSTISVKGPSSSGVEVWSGGEFRGERLVITTSSNDYLSTGLAAWELGSRVTLTDSAVSVSGQDVVGALSLEGATVGLQGVAVTTAGADAHGLVVQNGGEMTASGTSVTAVGDGASAIAMVDSLAPDDGKISFSGGSLTSTQGPLILVKGGDGAISLNGPVEISAGTADGRQMFALVTNAGTVKSDIDFTLDGVTGIAGDIDIRGAGNTMQATFNASRWVGNIAVDAGNAAHLALAGSEWTGSSANVTSVTTDAGGIWNVTASSDAAFVANAGLVAFDPAAAGFPTLTVHNYVGHGGYMQLNTVLEGDGSPSNMLVVNGGAATGVTGLRIVNAGGGGALTTADGIQVVKTLDGATTEAGAFSLANRVVAGAYEYLLFRGGETSSDDWFLRSHQIASFQPETPIHPETPIQPEVPIYRPEVALYAPVPAMARQMGLATLGTLHERVGEQMNIAARPDQNEYANGVWARLIGEARRTSWSGSVNARARDTRLFGIQSGFDIYRAEHSNGHRDHIGVYAAYTWQNARMDGRVLGKDRMRVGELKLDGPALGAYWTHYTPQGAYLDGVVQMNWFDAHASSDFGPRMKTSGSGFTASLEAGHSFQLNEAWQFEPQAQIIYQSISVKGGRDHYSSVTWREDDALTGRLGFRIQYTSKDEDRIWQPYAKVNLWHGFRGADRANFDRTTIYNQFGETSLELGGGFTARLSQTASIYGHLDHRWSLDGREKRTVTQGGLGLRVNW